MKQSHIHDAIGELSEEMLMPVAKLRQKKRQPWVKWVAMAAGICLLLGLPLMGNDRLAVKSDSLFNGSMEMAPAEKNDFPYSEGLADGIPEASFQAKVLEIHEGSILVEPLAGENELHSGDRFEISFANLKEAPEVQVGDTVEIVYDGLIQEVYPCRITGVISVTVVE